MGRRTAKMWLGVFRQSNGDFRTLLTNRGKPQKRANEKQIFIITSSGLDEDSAKSALLNKAQKKLNEQKIPTNILVNLV